MKGKKSTNIQKRISGTDRPDRMDPEIKISMLDKLPPAPRFLNKTGRKIYRTMGTPLLIKGIVNELTLNTWVMFCRYYSMWYDYQVNHNKIEDMIIQCTNKSGYIYTTKSPDYEVARDCGDRAKQLISEFGFSPVSMGKIAGLLTRKGDNEYEDYLNGKN